ncbi:MAG: transporter substrate-binding domain-containing protein [Chlamydiota bacterium]
MKWQPIKKGIFFSFLFLFACGSPSSSLWKLGLQKELLVLPGYSKNAYLEGFLQDLLQAIAEKQRRTISLVFGEEDQLFYQLEEGQIGGIFTLEQKNALLEERYHFSPPIIDLGVYLIAQEEKAPKDSRFREKVIGYFARQDHDLLVTKYPEAVLRPYGSYRDLFAALDQGEIDAAAAKKVIASSYINEFYMNRLFFLKEPLAQQSLYLLSLKNSEQQGRFLERAFSSIPLQEYERLEKKWSLTIR